MKDLALDTLINIPLINLWLFVFYFFMKSHYWKRVILYTNFLLLLIFAMPITSTFLKKPLYFDSQKMFLKQESPKYVLILSAGIYNDGYGKWYPSSESIRRVQFGNFLSKKYSIPMVLSGGGVHKIKEADILANYFKYDFEIIENKSLNTFESAMHLKNYKEIKDASFLLATNPNHHLRTILVFKKQNIEIILPNEYVKNKRRVNYSMIPNKRAVSEFNSVVYEYLGLLWYFLNGRI